MHGAGYLARAAAQRMPAPVGSDDGEFVDLNIGGSVQHPSVWGLDDAAAFAREVIDHVHAELVSRPASAA